MSKHIIGNCPNCNSQDTEVEDYDINYENNLLERHLLCEDCDEEWDEVFEFKKVGYIKLNKNYNHED